MLQTLEFLSIQIMLLFIVTSVHTYIGLHIIRRGIIFSDLVLDQLAALGVILGVGMGIQGGTIISYCISMVTVLVGAFLLAYVKSSDKKIPHEAIIGILYALALVASIMVADKITGGAAYVTQTLSGTMLWVNWDLVIVTVIAYICLSIFHWIYRRKIIGITENASQIKNQNFWDLLFFITQGIITVLIVPIAGVLLAYGFLMIPAATALLFTRNWKRGLILGWGIGFTASLTGLFSSYYFKLPYGPTLVLSLGICFGFGLAIKMIRPVSNH